MSDGNDKRQDFIKEMYRVYWANMARSMEGIWKVIAPITVVGTILAGIHKDYLPTPLGLALAIIVILWAWNIAIDLNAWHRRNLFFATKAEQIFLSSDDYGRLLPAKYITPKQEWITFYKINVATFVFLLILTLIYAAAWKLRHTGFVEGWLLPLVVLIVGVTLTLFNMREQEKSARRYFKELFEDKPT
jgi:hypothetical protein